MLVEMLVKEVILYNDKAEIIFNTPTRMNLDESQGFSLGYSKKGKPITIEIACIRKMMKLINRRTSDYYRSVSLETLTPVSEPSYEIKEEVSQDYTLYEKIVSSLNLTENMRIALECRQNGLSYPEIGRVLSRAQATVYEYFIKMRQRYMAIYG